MATLVRVRRTQRERLRLGKNQISNSTNGTLIDLEDQATLRDFRNSSKRFVVIDTNASGASGADSVQVNDASSSAVTVKPTGGQRFVAVELPAGFKVTTATFVSGATAVASPLNQWAALWKSDGTTLTCVAVSADATNGVWAADTTKTFTFTTPYTTPSNGFYYVSIMVKATSGPTLAGVALGSSLLQTYTGGPAKKSGLETSTSRTGPVTVGATLALSDPVVDAFVPFVRLA